MNLSRLVAGTVGMMCWIVSPAIASIDPSNFTTTYDCAEQAQNTTTGSWTITCDGLDSYGAWLREPDNGPESITTSANYSLGGGGRGQRHLLGATDTGAGAGRNNNSGSIDYGFTSRAANFYIRWYMRWESGLGMLNQKLMYFSNTAGSGNACQGHTSGCYLHLERTLLKLHVGGGSDYINSPNWGYQDLMGGSNSSDGAWHCWQAEFQTGGSGTGVVKVWVDNTLRLSYTNVDYRSPYSGFGGFAFPENADQITMDAYQDIDDVAISTTALPSCALGGGGGGGTLALFLGQSFLVATYTVQLAVMLGYLWERRAQIIRGLIAVMLIRQYWWNWRYRRAVSRWQKAAPLMLPEPIDTMSTADQAKDRHHA